VLKALEDLPGFFPEVRWFYSCSNFSITRVPRAWPVLGAHGYPPGFSQLHLW